MGKKHKRFFQLTKMQRKTRYNKKTHLKLNYSKSIANSKEREKLKPELFNKMTYKIWEKMMTMMLKFRWSQRSGVPSPREQPKSLSF